jgi:hypothetical protein
MIVTAKCLGVMLVFNIIFIPCYVSSAEKGRGSATRKSGQDIK